MGTFPVCWNKIFYQKVGMALTQNSNAVEKKGGSLEVPDTVYQRLVRMLISSAIKDIEKEKQGTGAKEIKVTKGA
jgi:hypothetical protein